MATIEDFKAEFGPLKEAIINSADKGGNMENKNLVRNERIKSIEYEDGRPDKFTKAPTYRLIVDCYPGKDERYGNRYSGFFTKAKIEGTVFHRPEPQGTEERHEQELNQGMQRLVQQQSSKEGTQRHKDGFWSLLW